MDDGETVGDVNCRTCRTVDLYNNWKTGVPDNAWEGLTKKLYLTWVCISSFLELGPKLAFIQDQRIKMTEISVNSSAPIANSVASLTFRERDHSEYVFLLPSKFSPLIQL